MAKELIGILKRIHEHDIIHQDLKPQNLMKDSKGNLYIIDFGLSTMKVVGKECNKKRGFIGTPRYASLTAHKGKFQTPRDDLESIMYVLAYLYMKKLPWLKINVSKEKKLDEIMKFKEIATEEFFKSISNGFFYAYEYIR